MSKQLKTNLQLECLLYKPDIHNDIKAKDNAASIISMSTVHILSTISRQIEGCHSFFLWVDILSCSSKTKNVPLIFEEYSYFNNSH